MFRPSLVIAMQLIHLKGNYKILHKIPVVSLDCCQLKGYNISVLYRLSGLGVVLYVSSYISIPGLCLG